MIKFGSNKIEILLKVFGFREVISFVFIAAESQRYVNYTDVLLMWRHMIEQNVKTVASSKIIKKISF